MILNKSNHLLICPAINGTIQLNIVLLCKILDQFIGTETLVTLFTIHQRIRKSTEMSGSNPCLRVHKNRAVNTDVVWILLNKLLPPCTLYVVLQFNTEITVIPCICQSTVDLRSRINKSSCLCHLHDFVHCLFHYVALTFSIF